MPDSLGMIVLERDYHHELAIGEIALYESVWDDTGYGSDVAPSIRMLPRNFFHPLLEYQFRVVSPGVSGHGGNRYRFLRGQGSSVNHAHRSEEADKTSFCHRTSNPYSLISKV